MYKCEIYKRVEIRVRVQAVQAVPAGSAGTYWSGSYSFFTGGITGRSSDRVSRNLGEKFATSEEAEVASFAAARQIVDREIRIHRITAVTTKNPGREHRGGKEPDDDPWGE